MKMLVAITRYGKDTLAVTLSDVTHIVSVNAQNNNIRLFNDFDILSLEIQTEFGLFASDIYRSGIHELRLVEDAFGNIINY